jgi:hypothetical protein
MPRHDTLEFDIRLRRHSECWHKWANGTFEFGFGSSKNSLIKPARYRLEALRNMFNRDSTDLQEGSMPGTLPTEYYYIQPNVLNGRFSIYVAGPDDYSDAAPVSYNDINDDDSLGFLIGRFRIIALDNSLVPDSLVWMQPYYYYQATAYKLEKDTLMAPHIPYSYGNDNLEMNDSLQNIVRYRFINSKADSMDVINFQAHVGSQRSVYFTWQSTRESRNKGFVIKRAYNGDFQDPKKLNYNSFVASYETSLDLAGLGSSRTGKSYQYQYDTLPLRDDQYCYRLYSVDYKNDTLQWGESCVTALHSVISYANISPQIFNDHTVISYVLDDDVYLTARLFDANGKEVMKLTDPEDGQLLDHKFKKKNTNRINDKGIEEPDPYLITFVPPVPFAQGWYEVVFVADPIDESRYFEVSRAVVRFVYFR